MEVLLTTHTPEGVEVVLPAIVWAKVLEEHHEIAELGRSSSCFTRRYPP
ncbi:MAG: hypothetical protein MSC31_03510 [Solirubrobacteraceae bacterium MAG38_C4-C5]|nr:hypothetical protein [Candidatus Siliceabacter maunaloa]